MGPDIGRAAANTSSRYSHLQLTSIFLRYTIEMATQTKSELARQVFPSSSELEYFSEAELVTQTGYPKAEWWPGVLVKELLDNALDVCEQAGVAPEIRVAGDSLTIVDNGPGIPQAVVDRMLGFATRTSDKAAYVSPTRGAQGNALKTVLAIPYVLNGGRPSVCNHRGARKPACDYGRDGSY